MARHGLRHNRLTPSFVAEVQRWKVEANALVVIPDVAQLFLDTVHKYVSPDAPNQYRERLREPREALRGEMLRQLRELGG
jgi:hypothetical protein